MTKNERAIVIYIVTIIIFYLANFKQSMRLNLLF